ncbi:hypothetical protein PB2503_08839 [Parvularcula bermudensis HTCC2503]|uniref:DUF805 domain-containing protein n=1 Tax=Parvularcula bermudensis (strain ATCC BAA-594 / HTCC2503 / KCTC 12087) TaxID=314260 RepID=E0TC30_PARBH|nr:DUF805 domain-containing protein [Parvularcula bermudensis]ADM09823.1 hypothetical protein PB2503_08839 [Parvularcula bermudensis HTCC2503]
MFDFLFNLEGRISRKGYLLGYLLPYFLVPLVSASLPFGSLAGFLYLWPSFVAVPIKRFHDMGVSGWYQMGVIVLLFLAGLVSFQGVVDRLPQNDFDAMWEMLNDPAVVSRLMEEAPRFALGQGLLYLVLIAQFFLFALKPGDRGRNRYGNDPLNDGRGFAD